MENEHSKLGKIIENLRDELYNLQAVVEKRKRQNKKELKNYKC